MGPMRKIRSGIGLAAAMPALLLCGLLEGRGEGAGQARPIRPVLSSSTKGWKAYQDDVLRLRLPPDWWAMANYSEENGSLLWAFFPPPSDPGDPFVPFIHALMLSERPAEKRSPEQVYVADRPRWAEFLGPPETQRHGKAACIAYRARDKGLPCYDNSETGLDAHCSIAHLNALCRDGADRFIEVRSNLGLLRTAVRRVEFEPNAAVVERMFTTLRFAGRPARPSPGLFWKAFSGPGLKVRHPGDWTALSTTTPQGASAWALSPADPARGLSLRLAEDPIPAGRSLARRFSTTDPTRNRIVARPLRTSAGKGECLGYKLENPGSLACPRPEDPLNKGRRCMEMTLSAECSSSGGRRFVVDGSFGSRWEGDPAPGVAEDGRLLESILSGLEFE